MLRCPPSCINLTSSDVAGLEKRLAIRQSKRRSTEKAFNIRLNRGPHHPTKFSIVSAEDNVGKKRAESSSSEATFDDGSRENVDGRLTATLDGNNAAASPERPPGHRLLSSARARRGHARSHDIAIREEGLEQSPTLDPGAPVFVPRIRFGSVESVATPMLEPRWGSLDSTHNTSYLRIRSTTEQNVEAQFRHGHSSGRETTEPIHEPTSPSSRGATREQRSRGGDQNTAFVHSAPDLERYPLLRPSASVSPYPRASNLLQPGIGEPHNVSRWNLMSTQALHNVSALDHGSFQVRAQHTFLDGNSDRVESATHPGLVSPAVSTTSRSTPNLLSLRIPTPRMSSRGSSWSWTQSRPYGSTCRIPSMESAASGINRDDPDAVDRYNLRRNSPLDELTEQFGRMRSVGRSWERTPSARPSLLNGDPFGQMPSQEPDRNAAEADPVALSLALPPSSPINLAHSQPVVTNPISRTNASHQIRRRRTGARPSEIENGLEQHVPGLEEDRRTWLSRRDVGTLEVTPPKEGRFERFCL